MENNTKNFKGFEQLTLGVDVGSTTCKVIVVNNNDKKILWQKYERHFAKQADKVLELLEEVAEKFPQIKDIGARIFITGSGAGPIAEQIGAKFVQEVNAVAMAVEQLHPEAGSVIELGGQDAKIIIFKTNPETGGKQAATAMNEKCASGTGATIDKCLIKVGASNEDSRGLIFDPTKLHHVAAKCGVFAETDIVNLVKSGIPWQEILNSLADAIVNQNLSVLTKGSTLGSQVILLGGPNTYLPFLQECWRLRIPQIWDERGYDYPKDIPIEDLIVVPDNAQYYAAYGAVLYGLHEPAHIGQYIGMDKLKSFIGGGRQERLGEKAGEPLVHSAEELAAFKAEYTIPKFEPAKFSPGQVVKGVIGLDGGSTSSKCVLMDENKNILLKVYQLSKGNPLQDMKEMLTEMKKMVTDQGATLEVTGFGATGYAAPVLEKAISTDVNVIETIAHMNSSVMYFGNIDVICDIGGQDIKVLFMKNGELRNFKLSNQCSAGNGMILQAMADQFNTPVTEYAENAFKAKLSPSFNYGCAVFLDSDRVNFQKEGFGKEELMAGLAMVLPKNIWQYVVQIPRMAELGTKYVLQGGTQYNQAALKAQVDYIKKRVPNAEVFVHPHTGEAGAIGAAIETLDRVAQRGFSSFIGLDNAINLTYTSQNDETTKCTFCPNLCSRTFIDTKTPKGDTARYISGFACDKGTVEDEAALKELSKELRKTVKENPNMIAWEARNLFRSRYTPSAFPERGHEFNEKISTTNIFGKIKHKTQKREFQRSSDEAIEKRKQIRVGMPKALNMWETGPFWRTFFEASGLDTKNIIFSDATDEKLSKEGMKYGSIDPCFPAKVSQAHIHNLLFHKHTEEKPLDYIYFPCITHIPSYLKSTMAATCCPIVQGTPKVMKVSFTKEIDFFAQRDIDWVDDCVTFVEQNYLKVQLYETWGERLGLTKDECDFAIDQGFDALYDFEITIQEKGKKVLDQVEAEDRMAIFMIGRPYHSDPGLNHLIPEEFQSLGYPIVSMRSVPKDNKYLQKYFQKDLDAKIISDPKDINDVWPENFSANSSQKVWAAKFAARHGNLGILDISNFKCGHDAPTYGMIESIVSAAKVPYLALHDLDQTKPAGSIKIRIKTYSYNLELRVENKKIQKRKIRELNERLAEKRKELGMGPFIVKTKTCEENQERI